MAGVVLGVQPYQNHMLWDSPGWTKASDVCQSDLRRYGRPEATPQPGGFKEGAEASSNVSVPQQAGVASQHARGGCSSRTVTSSLKRLGSLCQRVQRVLS